MINPTIEEIAQIEDAASEITRLMERDIRK